MPYPLIDPRTGQPSTAHSLARETGVAAHIIWHRYDAMGVRSMALLAPKDTPLDIEAERLYARRQFLRSPVGILSTHRLGDYSRARRQLERRAA